MMGTMATELERRIDSIRLQNLLSFRDTTLELRNLNLVIGPNASGKSNLLTALEILQGTRGDFRAAFRRAGESDLQWRGENSNGNCRIEATAAFDGFMGLHYSVEFGRTGMIRRESLAEPTSMRFVFSREGSQLTAVGDSDSDEGLLPESELARLDPMKIEHWTSVLSKVQESHEHVVLTLFGDSVQTIRVAGLLSTGRVSPARAPQSVLEDETRVLDDGSNVALVVNNLVSSGRHAAVDEWMSRFLQSYERLTFRIEGGAIRMFMSEKGLKGPLPAARFSDGTLEFLRLIAVIHEPAEPLILAIEEPETGLHPDAVRLVAEMIRDASQTRQILITTHSPELVDALSDDPESVIVCEKDPEEGTQFRRLCAKDLDEWLERYSLGELWTKGEIGGTRW